VGLGRGNVLGKEVTIDVDGDVDLFHDLIGTFREPAAPHLVAHDPLLTPCLSLATFAGRRQPY
jgi:hypothetical protein